ncbi:DUF2442 domain-containing protein [Bosea sp. (in: a-proteobacteria)]|uniref:DUF2442 domain-containing protein n=1 Tax=Bosea sp. (in: a-proteobacteria) TaxID=1871050 RepID=UPI002FCA2086
MSIAKATDKVAIRNVHCDGTMLFVDLSDGRTLGTPLFWYPRLLNATAGQRASWQLLGGGTGVHWPEIDEDLSLEGMLAGRSAPGVVT